MCEDIVVTMCYMTQGAGFRIGKVSYNKSIGATYSFLLVFHCIRVFIMYRFQDIISYFSKFKEVT